MPSRCEKGLLSTLRRLCCAVNVVEILTHKVNALCEDRPASMTGAILDVQRQHCQLRSEPTLIDIVSDYVQSSNHDVSILEQQGKYNVPWLWAHPCL